MAELTRVAALLVERHLVPNAGEAVMTAGQPLMRVTVGQRPAQLR